MKINKDQIKFLNSLEYLSKSEIKDLMDGYTDVDVLLDSGTDMEVFEYLSTHSIRDVIVIEDWAGRALFIGHFEDPIVDEVLDANRCTTCQKLIDMGDESQCHMCSGTGYEGDFEVFWVDSEREDNVYEFINY